MARSEWPDIGIKSGVAEQAGLSLRWEERVANTPNIAFRRMEIKVYDGKQEDYVLTQLVGYLGRGGG